MTYPNVRKLVNCRYKHCSFRGWRQRRGAFDPVVKILPQRDSGFITSIRTFYSVLWWVPIGGVSLLITGCSLFSFFYTAGENPIFFTTQDFIIKIGDVICITRKTSSVYRIFQNDIPNLYRNSVYVFRYSNRTAHPCPRSISLFSTILHYLLLRSRSFLQVIISDVFSGVPCNSSWQFLRDKVAVAFVVNHNNVGHLLVKKSWNIYVSFYCYGIFFFS